MNIFFRVIGSLALAAILFLCGSLAWFLTYRASRAHGLAADVLVPALASARSVTVSECVPVNLLLGDGELVPQSVSLSPSQIAELSRAVAGHFDYGRAKVPLCYQPPYHHIKIVSVDGKVCNFDVSFFCGIFWYKGHRHPLPTLLSNHLRNCFIRFGIPPQSEKAYGALIRQVQG